MLIYNTSFHINGERIVPKFLQFMNDEYLPRMASTGHMTNLRFVRLLTNIGEDMVAYALMADTPTVVTLKAWKQAVGDSLEAEFAQVFGESILLFSTTMRTVEL
jgi:hypothetical protein